MPEGDTIYRTAAQLRKIVHSGRIDAAYSRDDRLPVASIEAQSIQRIETRGKHLLIHLESGAVLHSHMGMTGSWHLYRVGQSWRKPRKLADLTLTIDGWEMVCFTPATLDLLSADAFRRHVGLRRLGPDILDERFDLGEAIRRLRRHDVAPLGAVIMNQTVACGVGNVYKSETLFLEHLDPFAPVRRFGDAELEAMWRRARQMMRRNLEGRPRRTRLGVDGARAWVYGRARQPCLKCHQTIRMRRQGEAA
ncbi:MAG: DNA-formamidopyrimidine glycosylase family protein, partial [Planctomycetota bacterium]